MENLDNANEEILDELMINEYFSICYCKIKLYGVSYIKVKTPYGSINFFSNIITIGDKTFEVLNGEIVKRNI